MTIDSGCDSTTLVLARRGCLALAVLLFTLVLHGSPAQAFCGFFVAKADTTLFNRASQVVLARDDVVGRVANVELHRPLMQFVSQSELGDTYGLLKVVGRTALFVHPGMNTPTTFEFDASDAVDGARP